MTTSITRGRLLTTLLASACLMWLLLSIIGCGGPAGGITLGVALNNAMNRVNEAIIQATEGGRLLEYQAGNEVAITIENMKIAYGDMLDKTIDKLDIAAKTNLDKIQQIVDNLERRAAADVKRILQQTQQIVNSLPFSNKKPQVTSYRPRFVAKGSIGKGLNLRIEGNFPQIEEPGFGPYIRYTNKQLDPVEKITQQLSFSIPNDALHVAGEKTPAYTKMELVVPYKAPSLLESVLNSWWFHIITFAILLIVLLLTGAQRWSKFLTVRIRDGSG